MQLRINVYAVIVLVILHQVLGFAWYSVLQDEWLAALGKSVDQIDQSNPVPFVWAVINAAALNVALAWLFVRLGLRDLSRGVAISAALGLALITLTLCTHLAFMGYGFDLMLINGGKEWVGAILSGAVLVLWRRESPVEPATVTAARAA